MHVRDAEQAKPHLEHNPLSLLGACYATPRRKLNDPGLRVRRMTALCTFRRPFMGRPVPRQFMRNAVARCDHYRARNCLPPQKLCRERQ